MTLVVGVVTNGKTFLVGDTALTLLSGEKSNPITEGCLKQYIVTDTLAVAFAGIREHFQDACPTILGAHSSTALIETVLRLQKSGQFDCDVLVAEAGDEQITIVSNGFCSRTSMGFVGDPDAFEAFAKFRVGNGTSMPLPPAGQVIFRSVREPAPTGGSSDAFPLYAAMKSVVEQSALTAVGGVPIVLATDEGCFQYLDYIDVLSDPLPLLTSAPQQINFGTAAQGGFLMDFGTTLPFAGNPKDIGILFPQGKCGIAYAPDSGGFREARFVRAETPVHWILETRKLFGTPVYSSVLSEEHCIVVGESLIDNGQHADAAFCYELRWNSRWLENHPAPLDRYAAGYATALWNLGEPTRAMSIIAKIIETSPVSTACRAVLAKINSFGQ